LDSHRWDLFQCQRCGQCCEKLGLPGLSNEEPEAIAEFLNVTAEELIEKYYGKIIEENGEKYVESYQEDRRTPCPFLASDKSCKIYPVRPEPCRAYPLETDFGRCDVDCPGAKNIYKDEELQEQEEEMPHTLDLFFCKPPKGGMPFHPFAKICVNKFTGDREGAIFLTPECTTAEELDHCIKRLKKELDIIEDKAKQEFSKTG
jgi:Fe-S-cluster containining protein